MFAKYFDYQSFAKHLAKLAFEKGKISFGRKVTIESEFGANPFWKGLRSAMYGKKARTKFLNLAREEFAILNTPTAQPEAQNVEA